MRGDTEALLRLPRILHESGQSIEAFVSDTVRLLDAVHVQRVEGGTLESDAVRMAQEVRDVTNEELEQVISILVTSIDRRYSDPKIGFKIGITKLVGLRK